jgi:hypothetical protein
MRSELRYKRLVWNLEESEDGWVLNGVQVTFPNATKPEQRDVPNSRRDGQLTGAVRIVALMAYLKECGMPLREEAYPQNKKVIEAFRSLKTTISANYIPPEYQGEKLIKGSRTPWDRKILSDVTDPLPEKSPIVSLLKITHSSRVVQLEQGVDEILGFEVNHHPAKREELTSFIQAVLGLTTPDPSEKVKEQHHASAAGSQLVLAGEWKGQYSPGSADKTSEDYYTCTLLVGELAERNQRFAVFLYEAQDKDHHRLYAGADLLDATSPDPQSDDNIGWIWKPKFIRYVHDERIRNRVGVKRGARYSWDAKIAQTRKGATEMVVTIVGKDCIFRSKLLRYN